MSMIAKPGITAATEDVADTDDGDAHITTDDFWPETELRALRLACLLYTSYYTRCNNWIYAN